MTNKPMLSVERELLESFRQHLIETGHIEKFGAALFQLLNVDKPAAQHQGDKVSIERIDIQMLKGGKFRFISEPEGSLVFYRDHAELVEALSLEVARLNRVKFALAEKAAAHADNCAVCRIQLAEQPAPPCKHQGEPVAWRHTMHFEEGCGRRFELTDSAESPFGKPDVDYDKTFRVTREPLYAEQPAPVAEVPEGYCIMPRRLTAENGAKALLLGEFQLEVTTECPECRDLEEPLEGCEFCDGEGEYEQRHIIPWDQIKDIYSQAVAGLAKINKPL